MSKFMLGGVLSGALLQGTRDYLDASDHGLNPWTGGFPDEFKDVALANADGIKELEKATGGCFDYDQPVEDSEWLRIKGFTPLSQDPQYELNQFRMKEILAAKKTCVLTVSNSGKTVANPDGVFHSPTATINRNIVKSQYNAGKIGMQNYSIRQAITHEYFGHIHHQIINYKDFLKCGLIPRIEGLNFEKERYAMSAENFFLSREPGSFIRVNYFDPDKITTTLTIPY